MMKMRTKLLKLVCEIFIQMCHSYTCKMCVIYTSPVKNLSTVLNFEITSGKLNVVGVRTSGIYAQKWASYFA